MHRPAGGGDDTYVRDGARVVRNLDRSRPCGWIVDLRAKFGMPTTEDAQETCIIVVQVKGVQIGVVVDKVSEVANINEADVEPPPSFGADVRTDFLLGLGKSNGRVRLLLDIDRRAGLLRHA